MAEYGRKSSGMVCVNRLCNRLSPAANEMLQQWVLNYQRHGDNDALHNAANTCFLQQSVHFLLHGSITAPKADIIHVRESGVLDIGQKLVLHFLFTISMRIFDQHNMQRI